MFRAIQNGEPVAKAVLLKDGKVLQVFPSKETFESTEAWKHMYEGAEFQEESKELRKCKEHFKRYVSETTVNETPMQKVVRQLYDQYGLVDTMFQKAIPEFTNRKRSSLYCFYPSEGTIVSVYFNRTSGHVVFRGKIQDDTLPVGLSFFVQKVNCEIVIVKPLVQEKKPGQKVILYRPHLYHIDEDTKTIQRLIEEGFYIRFYNYPYSASKDFVKFLHDYHSIDYVIVEKYEETMYYIDTSEEHNSVYDRIKEAEFETWISDQKPKVVVSGLFGQEFNAPATIDLSGTKLELVDVGHPIGIDENQRAFFKRQKSGIIQPLEVAEATMDYIKKKCVPCTEANCKNLVYETPKRCWIHET